MTAGELGRLLLDGEPRIASHAEGEGHSFRNHPSGCDEAGTITSWPLTGCMEAFQHGAEAAKLRRTL